MARFITVRLSERQAEVCRQALNFAADLRGSVPPHDPYFSRREYRMIDRVSKDIQRKLVDNGS